jgi:hypothetical protein
MNLDKREQLFVAEAKKHISFGSNYYYFETQTPNMQLLITDSTRPVHVTKVNGFLQDGGTHLNMLFYSIRITFKNDLRIRRNFDQHIIKNNISLYMSLENVTCKFAGSTTNRLISYEPEIDFELLFKGQLMKLYNKIMPAFPEMNDQEKDELIYELKYLANKYQECFICQRRINLICCYGINTCYTCQKKCKNLLEEIKNKTFVNTGCNRDNICKGESLRNCRGCLFEFTQIVKMDRRGGMNFMKDEKTEETAVKKAQKRKTIEDEKENSIPKNPKLRIAKY